MTKIRLQSIAINNFKGIRFLKLNMLGKNSNIQGANGSGKTTIYKAYYWCLTGKTLEPNETVQPLDEKNEVIHKLETSVIVTLKIDDSYEVELERKLVEDWKAIGMPDETLRGTTQKRFFNGVPFSQKEFDAKLNSICKLDKWVLLSNINAFMSLTTEDRRKMLMEIAGEVDEDKLMKPYPIVAKAIKEEKKSIGELQKQTLSTKKRSNEELKSIPNQIIAQERLKISEDFDAKKEEIKAIEKSIADIDSQLEGSAEELETSKNHREKVMALRKELSDYTDTWTEKYNTDCKKAAEAVTLADNEFIKVRQEKFIHTEELIKKAQKIASETEEFEKKKEEWNKENLRTYTAEDLTFCPLCGHHFTEEEKMEKSNHAVEAFNKEKAERLRKLLDEATAINQHIVALKGVYNEDKQIVGPEIESRLNAKKIALDEKQKEYDSIKKRNIEDDATFVELKKKITETEKDVPVAEENADKVALKAKKRVLSYKRDELTKIIAGEETNRRIEEEKARLNERSTELAQIVADCNSTLYQIMEYKKSKISAIEGKINSLFQIARWKFFEKNLTDENYSEVCKCLHNGVDYNSTNTADKINLGVDIVSGIGKAYGIDAPIFVDNSEAIAEILSVDNQTITLSHVAHATLTLNN